jgi:glycosyltransferase involved in cell wall biosynthesis
LSATLIALASSKFPVCPIVAENGSKDRTAQIALDMGAKLLSSEIPTKVAALQLGTAFAVEELGDDNVLYTDADILVGKYWASRLPDKLIVESGDADRPAIVSGPSIFTHGGNSLTDFLRTGTSFLKNMKRMLNHTTPAIGGDNMGIHFDQAGNLYERYQSIRPELFCGEERAMMAIVLGLGGSASQSVSVAATVVTRGDRVSSLTDCIKLFKDSTYRTTLYGDYESEVKTVMYDGSNAFSPEND